MFHFVLLTVVLLLTVTGLSATQPFWSTLPSTKTIERHDSLTGFDVTKYDLDLTINEITHYIQGNVLAYVTAESNLTGIDYNLLGGTLSVSDVYVNNVTSTWTHQNGIIHIPLNITSGQSFTTRIIYAGTPGNSPAPYNIGILFTTAAVYTLSNPDAGRYWWPSYDHPWDKALIDTHLTVRSDWLASANGLRQSIVDNGNGTRTHNWMCSYPVATYVVGIAAGPYVEYNQTAGTLPIQNFVLPAQLNNATADFSNVPEMISYFSTVYGAYPFEKYGHSIVPMSTYAAMEHQTQTTIGAAYINGNHTYETIVAHELAHQWMGNSVTPLTMNDVWLKESFATYSEALWISHNAGWTAACNYVNSSIHAYYINWENTNGAHTIYNPVYNEMFAPPTYQKAASILHMLRLKLGNAAFFNFVQTYYNTYAGSNVITQEIVDMAEQVSGQDLTQFFQQWIYSPGIPSANLTLFHDGISQVKVIAQTTSPTATQFDIEIPLKLPGSALLDSLVVRATPAGFTNYHNYNPQTDNLSNLLTDPNHWVLIRQYTSPTFQLLSCLPANHSVTLTWNALVCPNPITGYNVWRKQLPSGTWTMLNPTPLNLLTYNDITPTNGITYQYYITAVDAQAFQSLPSNLLNATPIDFPFDWGFLVVDETRDGSGGAISPNDQMVDDFYTAALTSMPFVAWDIATLGAPSLSMLSHYPLVLWHSDDFSEFLIDDNLSTLGSYILSGGKLLVSGWKYPSALPQSFFDQFFPGVIPSFHNSPVLISALSTQYPALHPDPDKLTPSWNGRLNMSYTFPGAANVLYTAVMDAGSAGDGEPLAIRAEQGGTLILLGFPLYTMLQYEASAFLRQMLPELYPAVPVNDSSVSPAAVIMTTAPNPFTTGMKISLSPTGHPADISIYNVKGQKVKSWKAAKATDLSWDGTDENQLPVSAGVYLIQLHTGKQVIISKALKLN